MTNAVVAGQEIQSEVLRIVDRTNRRMAEIQALPEAIRAQLDLQILTDMAFLLRYIAALHELLGEVQPAGGDEFVFH